MADLARNIFRRVPQGYRVNDEIADRLISHSYYTNRVGAHQAQLTVARLNSALLDPLSDDLERRLHAIAGRRLGPGVQKIRMARLKRSMNQRISKQMGLARKALTRDLNAMARYESDWMAGMMAESVPIAIDFAAPSMALLRTITTQRPMDGELLADWWAGIGKDTAKRVNREIQRGMIQGESVPQLMRRLRGSKASGFTDGAMQITRRHAETVVRTSVNHVNSQARAEVGKANADIVSHEVWKSTLDYKVTDICMSLDEQVFKVGEGIYPPAHMRCRSVRRQQVKRMSEIGKMIGVKLRDIPPGVRASIDGPLKGGQGMTHWFGNQSVARQNSMLGPGRAQMFRDGKLPLRGLLDGQNRPLSLGKLRKIERRK